jgi:peptidylprolyl isomerase
LFTALALALALTAPSLATAASALDPQNTLIMDTTKGRVLIQLRPDLAPNHVARVKTLTKQGFYDGTPFHRVIPGFMAQGGDPTGTGRGGSKLPNLKAEFSNANFGRGTIGAARGNDPNSANSQFFICFKDCSFLNGQYTIWGQVVQGMENVDKLAAGDPNVNDGQVAHPDKIIKMQIAADAK